jgi:hypothetical protein
MIPSINIHFERENEIKMGGVDSGKSRVKLRVVVMRNLGRIHRQSSGRTDDGVVVVAGSEGKSIDGRGPSD